MRIVLLLLTFANLLAFSWWQGWLEGVTGGVREPVRLARQIESDRLRVLGPAGESDARSSRAAAPVHAAPTPESRPSPMPGPGTASRPVAPPSAPPGVSAPAAPTPSMPPAQAKSATEPAAGGAGAAEALAKRDPLAESSATAGGTGASSRSAGTGAATDGLLSSLFARKAPELCFDLSGIEEAAADELRVQLEAMGARVEQTGTENRSGYVVFIKPAATVADARTRIAQLRDQGVRDIYLIQDGSYRLAVSLGVFRTMDSVELLLSRLRARGVTDAEVGFVNPGATRVNFRVRGPGDKIGEDALRPLAGAQGRALSACP